MLTGDNPLTACHVAKELKIATRKTLVLTEVNEGVWHWQSVGGGTTATMETPPAELGKTFDICLTGDVRFALHSNMIVMLPPFHFTPPLSPLPSLLCLGNGLRTKPGQWKDV